MREAPPSPINEARQEALRTRALARYPRAALRKPSSDHGLARESDLAPLIVEWASANGHTDYPVARSFGAVYRRVDGTLGVDPAERVVYTGWSGTVVDGQRFSQVVHLWAYPAPRDGRPDWRGIRATIGADGFPLAWEVLHPGTDERHLYVSASLERAATDSFGSPLPGRRFSVERSANTAPRTIVVRVIEDGPIPMGPYVFLTDEAREVSTLLCRCSPSPVDEFTTSDTYDLVAVESLEDDALAWMPPAVDLSRFLRWVDPSS